MTIWEALARIRYVTLRTRQPLRPGSTLHASVKLQGWSDHQYVRVSARVRQGETVEAMLWRALEEFHRREREGMPQPCAKSAERRRRRKLLHSAGGPAN